MTEKYHVCGALCTYRDAVETLSKTYVKEDSNTPEFNSRRVFVVKQCLSRIGIDINDVDKLNIIHITGTKGKGSTTSFTESILRHHGYKTGMLLSPHQVECRERIKINGRPISQEMFAKYFFEVHSRLEATKEQYDGVMPYKFGFYTLLATYTFLKENIDVYVVEVGIGGQRDSTNFIQKPWVCALSNVALDHVEQLGDTVELIAWNKCGIFKPGAIAFIGQMMKPSVMEIILSRAKENNIPVRCAPTFSSYGVNQSDVTLGIPGNVQWLNASLALQIAKAWMNRKEGKTEETQNMQSSADEILMSSPFPLTKPMLEGLSNCFLLCRCQIVRKNGFTYYLDGSHTLESVQECSDWYARESKQEEKSLSGKVIKILMLSLPETRDPYRVFQPLTREELQFDAVVFCPNNCYPEGDYIDREQIQDPFDYWQRIGLRNMQAWCDMNGVGGNEELVFLSIRDALIWVTQGRDSYISKEPTDKLFMVRGEDSPVNLNKRREASKRDLEKKIPTSFQDANHIQVFATGGLWFTGGILKLVCEDLDKVL